MPARHQERHRTERIGWLRAAVLGANDGIVSTASLVVGVAAANASKGEILVAGVAGLVAGAMSMAAGEYVSVSSQADTEKADLERERRELDTDTDYELAELTAIYAARGLDESLAKQVAVQLTAHDALAAHARDELGFSAALTARPVQAALASAGTFAVGAAMPLLTVVISPNATSSRSSLVVRQCFWQCLVACRRKQAALPFSRPQRASAFGAPLRWRSRLESAHCSGSRHPPARPLRCIRPAYRRPALSSGTPRFRVSFGDLIDAARQLQPLPLVLLEHKLGDVLVRIVLFARFPPTDFERREVEGAAEHALHRLHEPAVEVRPLEIQRKPPSKRRSSPTKA